jgi:recombination protein RecT
MTPKALAKPDSGLDALLAEIAPTWEPYLPAGMGGDAIINGFMAEVERVPKIAQCTVQSIKDSLLLCARLGLEPASPLGHVYLIPYNVKNQGLVLTVIVGYKGYLELMRRSGELAWCVAGVAYQDELDANLFRATIAPPVIEHDYDPDVDRSPAGLAVAYCAVQMTEAAGGGRCQAILNRAEVMARKARGQGAQPAWRTDEAAMWRKSAIRALLASGIVPLSADDQRRVVAARDAEVYEARTRGVIIPAEAVTIPEAPDAPALAPPAGPEPDDGHERPTKAELLKWGSKKLDSTAWRAALERIVGKDWSTREWTNAERDEIWRLLE